MNDKVISVITTSYNCSKYIETTLKSVLEQDIAVQYIVIDAASTDGTKEILDKYKNSIDVIVSEPDDGMYHGIQKGASYVKGDIMAWINADDAYMPWTFSIVENIFRKFPQVDWIIGQPSYMNDIGQCIKVSSNAGSAYPQRYIKNGWFRPRFAGYLQQESMFWRKSLWDKVGGLNLNLKLAADFDLWIRFAQHAELYSVATPLSTFRLRPGEQQSSVGNNRYEQEVKRVCENLKSPPVIWKILSQSGDITRVLSRMLIWKKTKLIKYSIDKSEWVIKHLYRPLSRYSFAEVLLEIKSGS